MATTDSPSVAVNNLIRFRPPKRYRSAPQERSAQILFFTGVRYQRMGEDAPTLTPPAACDVWRKGGGGGTGEGDRTRRR